MPRLDLADFLDDDALEIELASAKHPGGKVYTIPSPDATTGIFLTAMANLGIRAAKGDKDLTEADVKSLKLNDAEEKDLVEVVLGTAYQELIDDGISWEKIRRLSQYAFAYYAMGPQAAVKGVESGAFTGKAPEKNRAARRSSTRATSGRPASAASKSRTTKKS